MKRNPAFGFAGLALLCALGCAEVSRDQALADFKAENPTASVNEWFVGEGDGAAVYYHFQYSEKGSSAWKEVVWQYMKQGDGKWRVSHRSEPKLLEKSWP